MPYQSSLRTVLAACSILSIAPQALAHMEMSWPYPIRSKYDPANSYTIIDYSMTSPLSADGSNFPCKGYQNDRPIVDKVTYTAGSTYNMTLAGSATHGGGSCQLSLSYDNGATFRVIKSMIGGCPLTTTYDFTIPSYAPEGNALFAWTWQNLQGNREFYMNCAEVDITGSGITARAADSFDELPFIWKANLEGINDCATTENVNVVYPDPGPDVIYGAGLSSSSSATSGTCDAAKPFGQTYEYLSDSVNPTTENLGTTAASTAITTSSSRSVTTTLVTSSKATTSSTKAAASTTSTSKSTSSSTTSKAGSSSTTSKAASTSTTSKAASSSSTSKAVSSGSTSKAASSSSTTKAASTSSTSKAASASSTSKAASTSSTSKAASTSSGSKAASSSSKASTSKASSASTVLTLSTVRAGKTETVTGSTCPTDVTLTVYSSAASTVKSSGFVTSKVSASLTGSSVSTVVGFSTGGGSSTVVVVSAASSNTAKASTSSKKVSSSSATTSSAGAEVTEGYATGDLATYLPCVPGTFICTSNTTWVTCDQTMYSDGSTAWVYEESRTVAAGMACVPNLSPYSSSTKQYAQQADAPAGYYRDDRYAAAQTYGSCSTDGALECTDGGSEFMICDNGGWVMMGSVAAGTTCTNGAIVASS